MFTPSTYKRLRVDLVVDGPLEELAELADVDVRRRQNRLGEVGARSRGVVVLGGHACLREWPTPAEAAPTQDAAAAHLPIPRSATEATSETLILTGMTRRADKKRTKSEIAYVHGPMPLPEGMKAAAVDQMCDRNAKSVTARLRFPRSTTDHVG